MKDLKEKKPITKPAAYDDSELKERVKKLEEKLEAEVTRINKVWGRLGL